MTTNQPPSLEDQCLLRLVTRLEEYPPATLASLPLHLRLTLLRNLPAADVCELEHTAVTEGIDMDLNVWNELVGTGKDLVRPFVGDTGIQLTKLWVVPKPTVRQRFFSSVYNIFLHGQYNDAGSLLFSFCLSERSWKSFTHLFNATSPVPSRHKNGNSPSMEKVLFFAVQHPDCRPVDVAVDCSQFVLTELWQDRDVTSNLLSVILSDARSLHIRDGSQWYEEAVNVPRFLLQTVMNRDQPALTSLSLTGGTEFVCHVLADVSVFFSLDPGEYSLWTLYHSWMFGRVPYSGLTFFSVTIEDEDIPALYQEDVTTYTQSIILHQSALTSIDLAFPAFSLSTIETLCNTLGQLFHQPQFEILHLTSGHLSSKCLGSLLLPFFASSVFKQVLCFEDVDFDLGELDWQGSMLAGPSCSCAQDKVLVFLWVIVSDIRHLEPFFDWLSLCQCAQVCSGFQFHYRDEAILPGTEIKAPFMKIVNAVPQLEDIAVCDVTLAHEPSPAVPFCNLFVGPNLRRVELSHCGIGKSGLLPLLMQGLLKQIPDGQLEELNLNANQLGSSFDSDFQDFCEAVFSLPEVMKLTLSLETNELKPRHFALLSDAWKIKVSPKKIKSLHAQRDNDIQDELFMQNIASNVGDWQTNDESL